MKATDKARELLAMLGYNAALGVARTHQADYVDDSTLAYWDRVIAALEASRRPDSAVILQFPGAR